MIELSCTITIAMAVTRRALSFATVLLLTYDSVISNDLASFEGGWSDRYRIRALKEGPMPAVGDKIYKHAPHEPNRAPIRENAASVVVECTEKTMNVIVKADFYNIGRHISAEELQLGVDWSAGSCRASIFSDSEFIIEANLHECGTKLTVVDDTLVYSNLLIFSPIPKSGIIRLNGAIVPVECHYLRKHVVSSNTLKPTWAPFTSTTSAVDLLDFSLKLMTDDWHSEKSSNQYPLGDPLHIEASVNAANHVPLRIFMDSCIVTLTPDVNSVPRYAFIDNHGCLTDARVAGSQAHFMPRTLDNKLQMQLEAFKLQESWSSIYITCHLKVTAASQDTDSMNKACSYVDGRWQSMDGKDLICGCCDTTCEANDFGKSNVPYDQEGASSGTALEKTMTVGPVSVA